MKTWDVFISHASEDKEEIATPIYNGLKELGLKVWYDKEEIQCSNEIVDKISYGLEHTTYFIIILSPNFIRKDKTWTNTENQIIQYLKNQNSKKIIPIYHNLIQKDLDYNFLFIKPIASITTKEESLDSYVVKIAKMIFEANLKNIFANKIKIHKLKEIALKYIDFSNPIRDDINQTNDINFVLEALYKLGSNFIPILKDIKNEENIEHSNIVNFIRILEENYNKSTHSSIAPSMSNQQISLSNKEVPLKSNLSILYFYGINYDDNNNKLKKIRDLLIDKINKQNIYIDLIIFSGNLVKDISKNSLKEAYEFFIEPLYKTLNIDKNNLFFTIGNQDMDLGKRNKIMFSGLKLELIEKKDKSMIRDFIANKDNSYNLYEFSNYLNFINSLHQKTVFENTQLYTIQKSIIGEVIIGVVSINSSLFLDKKKQKSKKLWLPKEIFNTLNKKLDGCNIKILNMHHPFDWFINHHEIEQEALEKFNIVFYANKNNTDNAKIIADYNNRDVVILDSLSINDKKQENGYSILLYDIGMSKINIINTIYSKQQVFEAKETKIIENIDLTKKSKKSIRNKIISNKLLKKVQIDINRFLTINLTSYTKNIDIETIFIHPIIVENEKEKENKKKLSSLEVNLKNILFNKNKRKKIDKKIFTIQEIIEMKNNILLIGEGNSGKTTLLNYINLQILKNYYMYVPIYIDCNTLNKEINSIRFFESKINDYLDTYYIEKNNLNINEMIKEKRFIFLMDNIKNMNKTLLNDIINLNNRIIATVTQNSYESIENTLDTFNKNKENKLNFNELKIKSFRKKECFSLTQKIVSIDISEKVSKYVYKTILDMKLPFNPFIATLLSWMYMEKIEIRESEPALIEVFLDYILEKSELSKKFQGKFDFFDKIDLLAVIAHTFYLSNRFAIERNKILKVIVDYVNKYAIDINPNDLLEYFYDRKVFIQNKSIVMFSYRVFYYYFISKYMEQNNNFKNDLLSNKSIISNMSNELRYYASIKRDDINSIELISQYIRKNKFQDRIKKDLLLNNSKYIINRNIKLKRLEIKTDNKSMAEKNKSKENDKHKDIENLINNELLNKRDEYIADYNYEIDNNLKVINYKEEYFTLNLILSEFIKRIKMNKKDKEKYILFIMNNFTNLVKYWELKLSNKKMISRYIKSRTSHKDRNRERFLEEIEDSINFLKQQLLFILVEDGINALTTPKLIKLYNENFDKETDSYKFLFYCLILIQIDKDNMIKTIEEFISYNHNNILFEILFFSLLNSYQNKNYTLNKKNEIKKILKNILMIMHYGKKNKKIKAHVSNKIDEILEEYFMLMEAIT